jgi:hypothetical protein
LTLCDLSPFDILNGDISLIAFEALIESGGLLQDGGGVRSGCPGGPRYDGEEQKYGEASVYGATKLPKQMASKKKRMIGQRLDFPIVKFASQSFHFT